jgi:GNAT superfamily N-acetyltransferase
MGKAETATMQDDELTIAIDMTPAPEEEQILRDGLRQYNEALVSGAGDVTFAIFLRTAGGTVRGGLMARAGRGWLHIGNLWVAPDLRRQGYATRLMAAAEEEGMRRGCHSAYLDTFSFQARPFYERRGYEVFGTLDNYPGEHQRFFMRKRLKP